MKIFRRFLTGLIVVAVLAGLLLAVAYSPLVQTWYVERLLAQHPGFKAKVHTVSAGFSRARLEGVQLERGGATLTIPALDLGLSLVPWLRGEKPRWRTLVAKDWVLKLDAAASPTRPGAEGASASSTTPTEAARVALAKLGELLLGAELPADVTIDNVDLEGDVIGAAPAGGNPLSFRVALKGGPFVAGETAVLHLQAAVTDERLPRATLPLQGEVKMAIETTRRIARLQLTGSLAPAEDTPPGGTPCGIELSAARGTAGADYRLALQHEGRRVIEVSAHQSPASDTLTGEWKIDWRATDLAIIGTAQPSPIDALTGAGRFEVGDNLARIRVAGHGQAGGNSWKVLAPELERIGPTTVTADFEAQRRGGAVEFERVDATVTGAQLSAQARTLRPVTLDLTTGSIGAGTSPADWLDVEAHGMPMAWFADFIDGYTLSGGPVAGEFLVGGTSAALKVRSKTPTAAVGVSLGRGANVLARGMDVAATIKALIAGRSGAWQVEATPLTLAQGGTTLARLEGQATREAGEGKPIALKGKWSADIAALATRGTMPRLAGLPGRTASGEMSGALMGYLDLQAKFRVIGLDPAHTLEGTLQGDFYPDGTVEFTAPLIFSLGLGVSDVQLEWQWRGDAAQSAAHLKLSGKNVGIDAMRRLALPLAAWGQSGAAAAERRPFWGDWTGQVRVDFERVRLEEQDLLDVGGYLEVGPGKVELINGHGGVDQNSRAKVQATLTFDLTREVPYEFRAALSDVPGDAKDAIGPPPKDGESAIEGRFTIEHSITAKGASLEELLTQREDRFKVRGKDGIVRALKVGIAQVLPSAPEGSKAVSALDDVGSAFGRLFGSNKKAIASGVVQVNPQTEAVLDLDLELAEIGYDSCTIAAVRTADGTVRITEFDLMAPNLHLTATGEIARGNGVSRIGDRPVSLEMRIGAQGRIAELMEKAGLFAGAPAKAKDANGYRWLDGTFHAGGTLKRLDQTAWRAKLVEAATRKEKPAENTPEKKAK